MSGTLPTSPVPAAASIISRQPTLVSETHSLQRQVRTRGGQRWGIKLSWRNLRRDQIASLFAFAIAQRGQYEAFTLTVPGHTAPLGIATGTPVVNGSNQAGRSLVTSGWTSNTAGILKAGTYLKCAGHSKVYLLTADASSDALGVATLAIEPALIATPANSEALVINNVPFTVSLASDIREVPLRPGIFMDLDLDMVEVLA